MNPYGEAIIELTISDGFSNGCSENVMALLCCCCCWCCSWLNSLQLTISLKRPCWTSRLSQVPASAIAIRLGFVCQLTILWVDPFYHPELRLVKLVVPKLACPPYSFCKTQFAKEAVLVTVLYFQK